MHARTLDSSTRQPPWSLAFRALRAPQWLHFCALPLASLTWFDMQQPGRLLALWLPAVLATSTALAFAYGLNAIHDRFADGDPQKNPLSGMDANLANLAAERTLWLVRAMAVLTLLWAGLVGVSAVLAAVVSLVTSTIYSAGPQWKLQPLLGTLLNVGIFAPLLLLVPMAGPGTGQVLLLLAVFLPLLVQNQLIHECADAAEDATRGALTTARLLGLVWTRRLAVAVALPGGVAVTLLAPARLVVVVALLALTAGAMVTLAGPQNWGQRRALHRVVCVMAGALTYGACVWAAAHP